jgi:hypothetical protein
VELARQAPALREGGRGVAALSYDSPAVLKDFASRKAIPFPLLSDPDSAIIRRFGLLNEEYPPGQANHGVPHPGTFVTDERGIIVSKSFEEGYVPRRTAAALLSDEGAAGADAREHRTPYFVLRVGASNRDVRPGFRVALVLDFEMGDGLHAYAPGAASYRPLALRLEPHPLVTVHETVYPPSRSYHFAPLKETVPVFEGRFRLLRDVTFAGGKEMAELLARPDRSVTLTGELDYQVCSASVCRPPGRLPLSWTFRIEPMDRERVPEPLRRR